MVLLSDVWSGRDNNLNLLRALAATAVLVSHAFPIALGPGASEPLEHSMGYSLGAMAVFVFFVISGFLITGSFERSSSRISFVSARFLRLFPGLLVNLLFVAFLLGPLVTTLPLWDYFTDPAVYSFVIRDVTLLFLQYELPGVFQTQPYPPIVGSIWTLIYEVACYCGVFLVGILGALRHRGIITAILLAYLALWLVVSIADIHLYHRLDKLLYLSLPFAFGMAAYIWKDRLPLTIWAIPVLAALSWLTFDTPLYYLMLTITISYATLWLAYIPGGILRSYTKVGDYSYGIYVYAFPLQGFAVWLFGPQSALENMLYALPMTLVVSVASWHLVEEPFMRLKPWIVARLS